MLALKLTTSQVRSRCKWNMDQLKCYRFDRQLCFYLHLLAPLSLVLRIVTTWSPFSIDDAKKRRSEDLVLVTKVSDYPGETKFSGLSTPSSEETLHAAESGQGYFFVKTIVEQ